MKLNQLETTYICQFSKPQNMTMLEGYRERRDNSKTELAHYYEDVIEVLKDTKAWGVSGVNKMLNELTKSVRATINKEKKGKTSAFAHAAKLLNTIKYYGNTEARPSYTERCALLPLITKEELSKLASMI